MASLPPKNAAAPEPDLLDGPHGASPSQAVWGRVAPDAESLGATQPHTPEGTHEVMAARLDGLPHGRTFISDETGPPIMIRRAIAPQPGQRVAPASLVKLVEKSEKRPSRRTRENPIRRRLRERRRAIARRSQAKQDPHRQLPAPQVPYPEPKAHGPRVAEPATEPRDPGSSPNPKPAQRRTKQKAVTPPAPAPTNAFRPDGDASAAAPEIVRYREEVATLRSQLRQTLDEVDFWRRGMMLSLLIAGGSATAFFWPF